MIAENCANLTSLCSDNQLLRILCGSTVHLRAEALIYSALAIPLVLIVTKYTLTYMLGSKLNALWTDLSNNIIKYPLIRPVLKTSHSFMEAENHQLKCNSKSLFHRAWG